MQCVPIHWPIALGFVCLAPLYSIVPLWELAFHSRPVVRTLSACRRSRYKQSTKLFGKFDFFSYLNIIRSMQSARDKCFRPIESRQLVQNFVRPVLADTDKPSHQKSSLVRQLHFCPYISVR